MKKENGEKTMSAYKLKTPKGIEKVVLGTYQRIENQVVGTYRQIETGAVDAYKKIEAKFVDTFLEKAPEPEAPNTPAKQ